MVLHSQNGAVIAKRQDKENTMNKTEQRTEFLRDNNLKLYRSNNGYLLADSDDHVLMSFYESTSSTSTSLRISIHKEPTSKFMIRVPSSCTAEITNLDLMNVSVLDFICQCYCDSIDYKVKGNSFSECARSIQKRTGFPWEICKMMVKLKNDEDIAEVYYALDNARLYDLNHENASRLIPMMSESASKREKRAAFKELIGEKVFDWLDLENRGNKYLNALATYLCSNYEFEDAPVAY